MNKEFEFEFEEHTYGGSYIFPNIEITIFFEKIKQNVKYVECIEITEKTKERLRKNSNYDMTIDNFMLNVWEEING